MQSLALRNPGNSTGNYSLKLPVNNSLVDQLKGFAGFNPGVQKGEFNNVDVGNLDFSKGLSNNAGYSPTTSGLLGGTSGGFDLGKLGSLAGSLGGAASLFMNYQAQKDASEYNDRNLSMLEEQQGLAKRAADTNYANQQHMAAQMGGYVAH